MLVTGSDPKSLVDVLARRAASQPHDRAYTFLDCGEHEGARLTWAEVDCRSRSLAAAIADRVPPGSRVLILCPPGLDFISAFFGCVYARAIAVPAYPPAGARLDRTAVRLRGMVADAGVALVLTTAVVCARAAALIATVPELGALPWLDVETVRADSDWQPERNNGEPLAFLQYTSGSTANPRGVMVSHRNLLHNLECSARLAGHTAESAAISWLPVNHDMGLIDGILQPAYSGFPVWIMAPAAFLQRPARWLNAISRFRTTHSGGPNFAYDLCVRRISEAERQSLDLTSWRIAFNGSEPVRADTLDRFHRAFAPQGFQWSAFSPAYGLAESTLLVSSGGPDEEPSIVHVDRAALSGGTVVMRDGRETMISADHVALVASGTERTGRIEIIDPATRTRCLPARIGEIWVASDSVAAGYWQRPDETVATFGAFLTDTGEGPFLRTGDLGFLHGGRLFITGRLKDVLIVRGLKHYPQDIERTVETAITGIRQGCCAAFAIGRDDEGVAVAAEIETTGDHVGSGDSVDGVIATIKSTIADRHGIQVQGVALLSPGALPKTTSGKLQRYACRDGLLSGSLPVLGAWTENEVWPIEQLTSVERLAS